VLVDGFDGDSLVPQDSLFLFQCHFGMMPAYHTLHQFVMLRAFQKTYQSFQNGRINTGLGRGWRKVEIEDACRRSIDQGRPLKRALPV
jgi:hypothetical protein